MKIDKLLDTIEAATLLGVQPNTMEKWRLAGEGPTFLRIGRSIRYHPKDIVAWIDLRRALSTSQPSSRAIG